MKRVRDPRFNEILGYKPRYVYVHENPFITSTPKIADSWSLSFEDIESAVATLIENTPEVAYRTQLDIEWESVLRGFGISWPQELNEENA